MSTSISTEKLELLTAVATEFIRSGQMNEFESIEVDLTWTTLDFGETMLPNISLKLKRKTTPE